MLQVLDLWRFTLIASEEQFDFESIISWFDAGEVV
jgi:hypothetical protein